jgi:hypothetical protein
MFSAAENKRSAISAEGSYADIRHSLMPVGWKLSRSRTDYGSAIAFDHAVPFAHHHHERVGIGVEGIAAEEHTRSGAITKQIKRNTSFFHFTRDAGHLYRSTY